MFRRLLFTVFVLLLGSSRPGAQDIAHKLDPSLKMLVHPEIQKLKTDALKKQAGRPVVEVLIKGQPGAVRSVVLSVGGRVGAVVGDITSAGVPLDAIREVAGHPSVERMEQERTKTPRNDRAAEHIRATHAHFGAFPLSQEYRGEGVLVGIIDTGIDFRHRDFRDPQDSTRSRILAIWDQEDPGGPPPANYNHGTLWTKDQIEGALQGGAEVRQLDTSGHGTHVAGSAAGNGAAVGAYGGMAPTADIVIVKGLNKAVDAATYIFAWGDSLNKPVVVNYSAGGHAGAHDGNSLEEQGLDGLVSGASGRVFVTAAGNEGSDFIHWGGFPVGPDSLWTYYHADVTQRTAAGGFTASMDIFGTLFNAVAEQSFIALSVDTTGYEGSFVRSLGFRDRTPWHSLKDLADQGVAVRDTLFYAGGQPAGTVAFSAWALDGNVDFKLSIADSVFSFDGSSRESAVGADLWRFMIKGQGVIHVWSERVLSAENPAVNLQVTDASYRPTDNLYTVGMPATANRVIAVGAYTNVEVEGLVGTKGALASFSSIGPTPDGRIKPEIVAPGRFVTSALSSAYNQATAVAPEGLHYESSGTSMASPVTAGALALYLQKNPTASNDDIRNLLERTARTDSFTAQSGTLPNALWGNGKLDIFAVLTDGVPASPDFTYSLPERWSMISVPVKVSGRDSVYLKTVFPDATSAFRFIPGVGYTQVDSLGTGAGYWLNLGTGGDYSIQGTHVDAYTTTRAAGWSIIGAPFGGTQTSARAQNSNIVALFRFESGVGYRNVTDSTLAGGRGYWVNMGQQDTLTLTGAGATRPAVFAPPEVRAEDREGILWVDSGTYRRSIHLGVDPGEVVELPPVPPSGLFDVRVKVDGGDAWQVPSGPASQTYPLHVQNGRRLGWDTPAVEATRWQLTIDGRVTDLVGTGSLPLSGTERRMFLRRVTTGGPELPRTYTLTRNTPNPFNPETQIGYDLPRAGKVSLVVYNILGQEVRTLVRTFQEAGRYRVNWDGRDDSRREVSTGVYVYRMESGPFLKTRRMLFLK